MRPSPVAGGPRELRRPPRTGGRAPCKAADAAGPQAHRPAASVPPPAPSGGRGGGPWSVTDVRPPTIALGGMCPVAGLTSPPRTTSAVDRRQGEAGCRPRRPPRTSYIGQIFLSCCSCQPSEGSGRPKAAAAIGRRSGVTHGRPRRPPRRDWRADKAANQVQLTAGHGFHPGLTGRAPGALRGCAGAAALLDRVRTAAKTDVALAWFWSATAPRPPGSLRTGCVGRSPSRRRAAAADLVAAGARGQAFLLPRSCACAGWEGTHRASVLCVDSLFESYSLTEKM